MRSRLRIVTLFLISFLALIFLAIVREHPEQHSPERSQGSRATKFSVSRRTAEVKVSVNTSWSMEYRVIHEPYVFDEEKSVLIVVTSAPGNLEKRNEIRRGWGSWPHVRVVYLIGVPANYSEEQRRKIAKEVSDHGDVVQIDFVDTYRNLTLKSCALVMWAVRNSWPGRDVVIKADDDTCVNMPLLSSILEDFTDGVYGDYREKRKPLRCKRKGCNKWGLTLDEYEDQTFPPHVQGAFYVITESVLGDLYEKLFEPKYLFIEDVYLTGLVTRVAEVPVRPMPSGARINPMVPGKSWLEQKNLVAQHRCRGKLQKQFWAKSIGKTP
ncbi:beta-1,3-galactosyltransferase 5 [Galendromus occidentalis]|uniref:Hexosyltransferase n=1 Tax=Galendromus occidentalis TaxID=34638 RepID=A0AAJ6W0E0_9ACAR|nr:beta-1,3-galactosyltransferase 5 [Galendromus occidentalis]